MSKATTRIFVSTLMGTIFLLLTDAEARENRFGMGPPVTEEIVAKAVAAEPAGRVVVAPRPCGISRSVCTAVAPPSTAKQRTGVS